MEETENALLRLTSAHDERAALNRAARSSERAVKVSRLQFVVGAISVLDVLAAERTRLDAEDLLAQSKAREATALVALYKSLAGGWPAAVPKQTAGSHRL